MYISYPSGMWKVKLLRNYTLVPECRMAHHGCGRVKYDMKMAE